MTSWLAGRKTYIVAGAMAALSLSRAMGWVDEQTYQILLGLLGGTGLATMRAGVTKSGPPS